MYYSGNDFPITHLNLECHGERIIDLESDHSSTSIITKSREIKPLPSVGHFSPETSSTQFEGIRHNIEQFACMLGVFSHSYGRKYHCRRFEVLHDATLESPGSLRPVSCRVCPEEFAQERAFCRLTTWLLRLQRRLYLMDSEKWMKLSFRKVLQGGSKMALQLYVFGCWDKQILVWEDGFCNFATSVA